MQSPTELRYQKEQRQLCIRYEHTTYTLSAEFLRVHSPSAEVQGHGGKGGTLPRHKSDVAITAITPVGHYAVKLVFSDGHQSGLYSWDWLAHLCQQHDALWAEYQSKVQEQDSRPAVEHAVRWVGAAHDN